ncbi:hydrophobin [Lanmaoa asiatica]|nr:hydrophobin [Lanmaoa asiatica]
MLVPHPLCLLFFIPLAYSGPLIPRNPHCTTGSVQCCQSVQSAGSPVVTALAGLLDGLPLLQGDTQVGLACSGITGAGSGTSCKSTSVCCNSTHYNGLINVGCSPIDL